LITSGSKKFGGSVHAVEYRPERQEQPEADSASLFAVHQVVLRPCQTHETHEEHDSRRTAGPA